ncbi:MAG TPA: GspH/FimT family pseudopilin [Steroidobacteraceae bacterium]|nr:GspH/FimT family pseudopilin [Steroidobacteraceae bacterium]
MRRYTRGFNLLELMVAIAIAGILLGIGVPSFTEFVRNSRMTAAANDLLSGMYAARTEAVKRRVPVTLCLSANPADASPDCLGAGETAVGWFVFADDANPDVAAANDANAVFDAGEVLLIARTFQNSIAMTPDATFAMFQANGFTRRSVETCDTATPPNCVGDDASLTQIIMCDSRGNTRAGDTDISAGRALTLTQTGRAGITRSITDIAALGGC